MSRRTKMRRREFIRYSLILSASSALYYLAWELEGTRRWVYEPFLRRASKIDDIMPKFATFANPELEGRSLELAGRIEQAAEQLDYLHRNNHGYKKLRSILEAEGYSVQLYRELIPDLHSLVSVWPTVKRRRIREEFLRARERGYFSVFDREIQLFLKDVEEKSLFYVNEALGREWLLGRKTSWFPACLKSVAYGSRLIVEENRKPEKVTWYA